MKSLPDKEGTTYQKLDSKTEVLLGKHDPSRWLNHSCIMSVLNILGITYSVAIYLSIQHMIPAMKSAASELPLNHKQDSPVCPLPQRGGPQHTTAQTKAASLFPSFSPTFFSLSPTHVLYLAHPQKRCLKIEARRWTGASDCHGNNVPRLQAIRPAGKLTTTAVMLQQSLLKNTVHNIWTDDDVKMFRSSKSRQDS